MDPNQIGQAFAHAAVLVTLWLIFVGAVAIALGGTVVAVVVRILFRPRRAAAGTGEPNEPNGAGSTIAVGSVAALLFLALGTALFGGSGSRPQWAPTALTTSAAAVPPTALATNTPAVPDTSADVAVVPLGTPEPGTGADPGMVAPGGPASWISEDGDYIIGDDIRSGTWVSSGGSKCMWALTKYADGGHPDPYRVYHANARGSQTAHVRKRDAVFRTWGCGSWRRMGS